MYEGAIYAELEGARSEAVALADLLERLPAVAMERQTPAGLSRLAWHIARDIEGIQREIEGRRKA
jgi:hypothetical protein